MGLPVTGSGPTTGRTRSISGLQVLGPDTGMGWVTPSPSCLETRNGGLETDEWCRGVVVTLTTVPTISRCPSRSSTLEVPPVTRLGDIPEGWMTMRPYTPWTSPSSTRNTSLPRSERRRTRTRWVVDTGVGDRGRPEYRTGVGSLYPTQGKGETRHGSGVPRSTLDVGHRS